MNGTLLLPSSAPDSFCSPHQRWFVLNTDYGTLDYYINQDDERPKVHPSHSAKALQAYNVHLVGFDRATHVQSFCGAQSKKLFFHRHHQPLLLCDSGKWFGSLSGARFGPVNSTPPPQKWR